MASHCIADISGSILLPQPVINLVISKHNSFIRCQHAQDVKLFRRQRNFRIAAVSLPALQKYVNSKER